MKTTATIQKALSQTPGPGVLRMFGVVLAVLVYVTLSFAQSELSDRLPRRSSLFMEALSYAIPDTSRARLEVYMQIPYEEVRFLKKADVYVGQFDITVSITTKDGDPVWNRVQTVEIRTRDFTETVSNRLSSLKQMTFDMEPGMYTVRVEVLDQDSKRGATVTREITVPDYSAHRLSISDAMIVTRMTTSGDRRTIVPNISSMIGDEDQGFFVFSEVYTPPGMQSLQVYGSLLSSGRDSVFGVQQTEPVTRRPHQSFVKFTRYELPMGKYFVKLIVQGKDSAGVTYTAQSIRGLSVRWSDLPASVTDLNKALDQMRYIARDNELEPIRTARTEVDKRSRFIEFWRKRDPDPQTQRNELMEEYFWRVEYANRNFSHYMEGWRTDRGMVYIRFGAPDNVERHPFETGTRPYEVWRYYNLNYEFVFVDETGFGDYRLQYPTTDILGRIRPDQ